MNPPDSQPRVQCFLPTDSGYLEKLFLSPIRLHILSDREAQWGGVGDSSEPFIIHQLSDLGQVTEFLWASDFFSVNSDSNSLQCILSLF